jgi:hypothetical protein
MTYLLCRSEIRVALTAPGASAQRTMFSQKTIVFEKRSVAELSNPGADEPVRFSDQVAIKIRFVVLAVLDEQAVLSVFPFPRQPSRSCRSCEPFVRARSNGDALPERIGVIGSPSIDI